MAYELRFHTGNVIYTIQPVEKNMKTRMIERAGKVKYGILAWLIGLPLPIIIILMFYRGCDF